MLTTAGCLTGVILNWPGLPACWLPAILGDAHRARQQLLVFVVFSVFRAPACNSWIFVEVAEEPGIYIGAGTVEESCCWWPEKVEQQSRYVPHRFYCKVKVGYTNFGGLPIVHARVRGHYTVDLTHNPLLF